MKNFLKFFVGIIILILIAGFSGSTYAFYELTDEPSDNMSISNDISLHLNNHYQDSRKLFPVDLKSANEDFSLSNKVQLLSESEKGQIINSAYNFSINNDKLVGEFSSEIVMEQSKDAIILLSVYDNGIMTYVDISEQLLNEGTNFLEFNDICAEFKSNNLNVKVFILQKSNFAPICGEYEFAVSYAPQICVDGMDVSHSTPMYIYGDEIMASLDILQKLGVLVQYDSETNIVYTMKNNQYLNMQLDNSTIVSKYGVEWQTHTAQRTPTIAHNDIYIPLTTVCDIYKFEIEREKYTGVVNFYTNEFLTNPSQNPEYCSFISNGLIFYSVVEKPYVYITNGSSTISYAAGGPVSDIIVEGDWIYYYNNDNNYVYKMNVNDGSKTPLFGSNGRITLFNGKIYNARGVYNIATGKFVRYSLDDNSSAKAYYILDKTYVSCVLWSIEANEGDSPATVYVKTIKVNTNTGEKVDESSVYPVYHTTYNSYYYFKDAIYQNDEWYISLRNDYDKYKYFKETTDGRIISSTKSEFEDAKETELINGRNDGYKYSKTNSTSIYKFTAMATSSSTRKIVRTNKKTQFEETLITSSNYIFLAAANDDFIVYNEFIRNSYGVITALNIMLADTNGNIYGALGRYSNGVFTPTI